MTKATSRNQSPRATETTPLLADDSRSDSSTTLARSQHGDSDAENADLETTGSRATRLGHALLSPLARVYFVSFLMSLTFSFTQTALVYSFRTMTCDEYYTTHEWHGHGDRCAIPAIEGATASNVAWMSTTTTTSTIVNLFTSAWFISRFGVKAAMFQQTFWAALRSLTQIYAEQRGGGLGMRIIIVTQAFNMLGSAGGFQLSANSYVALVSSESARTANFGVLSGIFMFGSGIGFTAGGLAEKWFGYLAPFQCAFVLLCFCTVFGSVFLPYYAPQAKLGEGNDDNEEDGDAGKKKKKGFLAPLKVFVPRKVTTPTGATRRDWNLCLLGLGTFFSVLATGYIAMALQLVAINAFNFRPDTSGYMLSLTLLVRAFFLMVCFPRIIAGGRRWLSATREDTHKHHHKHKGVAGVSSKSAYHSTSSASSTLTPSTSRPPSTSSASSTSSTSTPSTHSLYPDAEHPNDPDAAEIPDAVGQPVNDLAPAGSGGGPGSVFDLYFLRWSILLDGILTGAVSLATRPWHMYLAAAVLPFASGTGPASKGVILDFVDKDARADALSAIALVEKIAQVSTIGVFGYAFALLSAAGHPTLVFLADASIAFLGFLILLPVSLPRVRVGSRA